MASEEPSRRELEVIVEQALEDRQHWSERAQGLRERGPQALHALLLEAERRGVLTAALDPLVDAVAGQRYARHARLYWYTDLDSALAEARKQGKPVVSLRLLGELTEELSCANSRFFRVVLYPDPEVQRLLSERFVLHWSSERPAPKVTIDYGDGRKLVQTVTGNSIHYVLDERGRVLDALPGLQDPAAFAAGLVEAEEIAAFGALEEEAFAVALAAHHRAREERVLRRWRQALAALGKEAPSELAPSESESDGVARAPALAAAPLAMSKASIELPLVEALRPPVEPDGTRGSEPLVNDDVWEELGALRRPQVQLSAAARELMKELLPRVLDGQGNLVAADERSWTELVNRFEAVLAVDTEKNRLLLRRRIHERLQERPLDDFDSFNRWVYGALFLTPREDPWLGLVEPGTFSALPSNGLAPADGAVTPAPSR